METRKDSDKKFKGGVLIIGSLIWEEQDIRKNWRNQNLNMDEKILVSLPIRYGRISKSRNCTYSMIFSSECKSSEKIGKGYFIPFQEELTVKKILEQGKLLIDAEHHKNTNLEKFYWPWGCLGIAINPKINEEKSKELREEWERKFSNKFDPNQYRVEQENPIVSKMGVLDIGWQKELNDFDFVIGIATKPKLEFYPTPREIAIKMIVNKYDKYFNENKKWSIVTFQDVDIENELEKEVV